AVAFAAQGVAPLVDAHGPAAFGERDGRDEPAEARADDFRVTALQVMPLRTTTGIVARNASLSKCAGRSPHRRSLHGTAVVVAILMVADRGRDGLERIVAVRRGDRLLQIEMLDREVIVAVFVRAAH